MSAPKADPGPMKPTRNTRVMPPDGRPQRPTQEYPSYTPMDKPRRKFEESKNFQKKFVTIDNNPSANKSVTRQVGKIEGRGRPR